MFESFINHVEGIIYQVSDKLVVSKLSESLFQESIAVRYLSNIRSSVRSGGNQVRGYIDYGGLVGHILLSRRLIVGHRISGIMFTF